MHTIDMKRVTVSVPDEVDARGRRLADEEGTTLSQLHADAVTAYVQEKRRKQSTERVEPFSTGRRSPPMPWRRFGTIATRQIARFRNCRERVPIRMRSQMSGARSTPY